ncbi:leucine-rich repeat domain-containing protein [Clostridium sp. WILCCON 0269]|uniref:Leucine-rich repeat domain-containing protein n=1 Tax=Candidatus Clostridium eludens TaxID=3381663 RepID=A0ABW8SJL1_9CLOT
MKNKILIVIFFSTFLLIASNVQAVSFTDNQTVEANKTWTIKFNSDVELDDVSKQGITVTNSKDNTVNVGIQLGDDSRTVIVNAPDGGYTAGESYTLNVGIKVHSSKGKLLKNEYKLHFSIKNNTNGGEIVTFKDKNLEQAIRNTINKSNGDIYESDVEKITELNAEYYGVQDISGIEKLLNLQLLNLGGNEISSINVLKNLTNLKQLTLGNNKINDISVLNSLVNLQTLDLSYNRISDISVLKDLPGLQWLALFNNPISDTDIQSLKDALPGCEINEILVKKPNIYLYPEKTEEVSVNVIPKGKITKSIPQYNEVWKVTVDPSGKIDNTYDFLFYEASLNYQFTLNKGWIINKGSFNEQMNSILASIGLNSKEKADFIEYWSKELKWKSSRYAAYYLDPKEINEAIKLNLSKEPDSILRAYFYFVPLNDNENLEIKNPEIKAFKRNGFTVVEWGGISN